MKCKNCKYWEIKDDELHEFDDITNDRKSDYEIIMPAVRKYCKSPKVLFYQRPDLDGACVVDGSQYTASLITGPDFGCVNFEGAK